MNNVACKIEVKARDDGAMSVAHSGGDLNYLLAMLDNAKDALRREASQAALKRRMNSSGIGGLRVPGVDTGLPTI